jgi:hypothetical protein
MTHTKFMVKVSRGDPGKSQYIQRIDCKPVQTTLERNLALVMGKITAQEIVSSLGKSRWNPELIAVQVNA